VFRPILPPKGTSPPPEAPWWAVGRNWPRLFHQLVKISQGSLRALINGQSMLPMIMPCGIGPMPSQSPSAQW
jgi:hypothetical protein